MESIKKHVLTSFSHEVQHIFFSATYPPEVNEQISSLVTQSQSIALKTEALKLNNILQFRADLEPKKKIDFLCDLYEASQVTQCIIFVNSRKFAETVFRILKGKGLKANLIFGKGMEEEERQKVIQRFREGSITFLITTDLLARGFDVRTVKLVVNFDVPLIYNADRNAPVQADPETYIHRIGRGGRFGTKAIAVSLMDRDEDKKAMDQIVAHYAMDGHIHQLTDPSQVAMKLEQINEEEAGA